MTGRGGASDDDHELLLVMAKDSLKLGDRLLHDALLEELEVTPTNAASVTFSRPTDPASSAFSATSAPIATCTPIAALADGAVLSSSLYNNAPLRPTSWEGIRQREREAKEQAEKERAEREAAAKAVKEKVEYKASSLGQAESEFCRTVAMLTQVDNLMDVIIALKPSAPLLPGLLSFAKKDGGTEAEQEGRACVARSLKALLEYSITKCEHDQLMQGLLMTNSSEQEEKERLEMIGKVLGRHGLSPAPGLRWKNDDNPLKKKLQTLGEASRGVYGDLLPKPPQPLRIAPRPPGTPPTPKRRVSALSKSVGGHRAQKRASRTLDGFRAKR